MYNEFGGAEKVQNLMPRRYERSANSNYVDGVRVSRTTYYTQLEDDVAAPTGTPTEQVALLEPIAYKHAADTNLPFTRTTFYWNVKWKSFKIQLTNRSWFNLEKYLRT